MQTIFLSSFPTFFYFCLRQSQPVESSQSSHCSRRCKFCFKSKLVRTDLSSIYRSMRARSVHDDEISGSQKNQRKKIEIHVRLKKRIGVEQTARRIKIFEFKVFVWEKTWCIRIKSLWSLFCCKSSKSIEFWIWLRSCQWCDVLESLNDGQNEPRFISFPFWLWVFHIAKISKLKLQKSWLFYSIIVIVKFEGPRMKFVVK